MLAPSAATNASFVIAIMILDVLQLVACKACCGANPSQQRWLSVCHAGGERSDPYTISWALGGDRTVRSGPPLPLGAPGKEARCQSPESGAPEREDPSGPAPTPWARLSRQWGETWALGPGCRPGRGGQVDK